MEATPFGRTPLGRTPSQFAGSGRIPGAEAPTSRILFPGYRFEPSVFFNGNEAPTGTNPATPPTPAASPASPAVPPNPQPGESSARRSASDRRAQREVEETLDRHGGDKDAALLTLTKQLHRKQDDETTAENDVAELAEWRKLGENPAKVAKEIATGRQATADLQQRTRSDEGRQAAQAAGFDPDAVLSLAGVSDWETTTETTKETVKDAQGNETARDVTKAFRIERDKDGKESKRTLYGEALQAAHPTMVDKVKAENGNGGQQQTQQKSFTPVHGGAPVGGGKPSNYWDQMRAQKQTQQKEAAPSKNWMEEQGLRTS